MKTGGQFTMIKSPQNACMSCFTQHAAPTNPCPVCGYDETAQELPLHILRPRTILNGKYLLGKVLGQGGFGITYIGWDLNLDIKVAIKEYYPSGFVTRETSSAGTSTVQPFTGSQGDFFLKGREKFINEAKTLAKFFALPGIVSIKDYFQENGTAYISMEYIEGQTLKDYLSQMGGRLPAGQIFEMMKPVMSSLAEIHSVGLIHRDISPDNIMISKEGHMKLLDFGAARDFTDSGNQSMSIMLKPGFAPEEQYRSRGVQGPWTDVYALSATIYKCITGVTPEESVERVHEDQVRPPSMLGIPVDPSQETALMIGMAVLQKNRFQGVSELYNALYAPQSGAPAAAHPSAITPPAVAQISATMPVPDAQKDQSTIPADAPMPDPYMPPIQATAPVFEPTPVSTPVHVSKKPKKMTKEKWIIAIACGVVAGVLSFAWSFWQQTNNRADTPDSPVVSPPSIELPAANGGQIGTWIGTADYNNVSAINELMLDDSERFYFLEYGFDDYSLYVQEGTYTVSGSRLQMTFLWIGVFNYYVDDGNYYYDMVEMLDMYGMSTETNISIDADTLHLDSFGFGEHEIVLTRGVPSGLWSFEHIESLINMPTPDSQSPRDTTHIATVTLREFQHFGGSRDTQRGWFTDGVDGLWSPYTARQFTDSQYLILEFDREPHGEIEFAWIGDSNNWAWTTTSFTPQGRILIIDLSQISGYSQYKQATSLKIYINCYDDSWENLVITDAYFANAR